MNDSLVIAFVIDIPLEEISSLSIDLSETNYLDSEYYLIDFEVSTEVVPTTNN